MAKSLDLFDKFLQKFQKVPTKSPQMCLENIKESGMLIVCNSMSGKYYPVEKTGYFCLEEKI